MKLKSQKYLTYGLISLYMIVVTRILPALRIISINTAGPLFFLGIFATAPLIFYKEEYGTGNINKYPVETYKSIWKDSNAQIHLQKKKKKKKMRRKGLSKLRFSAVADNHQLFEPLNPLRD